MIISIFITNGCVCVFLSKGGSPYPGMDVLELIEKLESGYRMEKPHHLHDEV